MSTKIPVGTVVSLSDRLPNATRRNVLRSIGGVTVGTVGLTNLVEQAVGATPDGKVLTLTTDVRGNPDTVRVVPPERYRRLKLYERMPAQRIIDRHDPLTAISITQRSSDPSDIGFEFILDAETDSGRSNLPTTYRGVPISYEERTVTRTQQDISGGLKCSPSDLPPGTTTVVGYDTSSGNKVVLTAEHVTESSFDLYIGNGEEGTFRVSDATLDAVSYTLDNPEFGSVGKVEDIQNITGAWTFSGLADTVGQTDDGDTVSDGETVAVDFYGQKSGALSDVCNNTKRTGKVDYQADMKDDKTQDGDSGGPWVDGNGKLLALHVGTTSDSFDRWSYGTVGQPVFDSLGVSLSK